MSRPTHAIDMSTLKMVRLKREPVKHRRWYYQHPGEEKQEIEKQGKWWHYNPPAVNITKGLGGTIGCDTLGGAKGDLLQYEGTKVWSELK